MVINYNDIKIIHNKNWPATRPARYSLAWPYRFSVIICGGRKMEIHTWSGHAKLRAWKKACSVCELARALVNGSWSMNIAASQLEICENKVVNLMHKARYRVNEELMIPQMFSRELRQ